MELSVIICDDLAEERSLLRRYVQAYGNEKGYQLRMGEAACGDELLNRWQPEHWDLVLLDIYMPGLSGVETARRLRAMDASCEIAFVTTSEVHGLVGYDLGILDYLVKPVDRETIFDMLDWCIHKQWERLRTLRVRSEWEEMEVRLQDICYIEIQRHTACISLREKTICTRRGMAELEEEIDSPSFLRCHRGFLVNLAHVVSIQKNDFLMDNGQRVPISTAKAQQCRQKLMEWVLEQGWNRRSQADGQRL